MVLLKNGENAALQNTWEFTPGPFASVERSASGPSVRTPQLCLNHPVGQILEHCRVRQIKLLLFVVLSQLNEQ